VREKASHVQRIDKTLQDANVKIGSVLTDIMGRTGRTILDAIVAGESDPEKLVARIDKRVKATRVELLEALRGRVTKHHRFLLKLHLHQIDELDQAIASVEEEVGDGLAPFRAAVEHLLTIPGVSDVAASVIVAEIGIDCAARSE
jgi:transposase